MANQIAAGEVIERPASVVKELLENAYDANAEQVVIEIGYGGLNQITVSDDGCGILPEDLELALAPHATSKLLALDDLACIATLGFRGEALASIASVSRLSIETRTQSSPSAFGVRIEHGVLARYGCVRIPGTSVMVRDLFFNAPVRKKFLKTPELEYLAIESLVKRMAFCQPSVGLTLIHNDKVRLRLPRAVEPAQQQQRLRKLLGAAFCTQALAVDVRQEEMLLCGWISPPALARSQQDKQWVYLNGRLLRDKLLLQAIRLAYEDLLPVGRYPLCVLTLNMPLTAVDVNVHPTKHEVRFNNPRRVHDFIRVALRERLIAKGTHALTEVRSAHAPPGASKPVWQCLNGRFALLSEQEQLHLIDVASLRRRVMLAQLLSEARPWVSRALLFTVYLTVSPELLAVSEAYQSVLLDYGVEWRVVEGRVCVQAIPRDLPGVDLRGLLMHLAAQQPQSSSALIQAFLASEAWDLRQMPPDEQVFWCEHWRATRSDSRCLDELGCEELLRD